jgi:putative ubiquitin-RnfH superfamily antitoxin RatB of RatAB toxin-antitoxin module
MNDTRPSTIRVEVAYVGPEAQFLQAFDVPQGTTLAQAIGLSGIEQRVPGLVVDPARVGIFAKPKPLTTVLSAGDRVEIYRPLQIDPKESRRQRAAKSR